MTELKVGHTRCRCPTCKKFFNSASAFDKHRTGSYAEGRQCLSADDMKAIGMDTNNDGYWVTALMPPGFTFEDEGD